MPIILIALSIFILSAPNVIKFAYTAFFIGTWIYLLIMGVKHSVKGLAIYYIIYWSLVLIYTGLYYFGVIIDESMLNSSAVELITHVILAYVCCYPLPIFINGGMLDTMYPYFITAVIMLAIWLISKPLYKFISSPSENDAGPLS